MKTKVREENRMLMKIIGWVETIRNYLGRICMIVEMGIRNDGKALMVAERIV